MDETITNIKRFHTLADAIAFISECLETNSARVLFDQTVFAEMQAEKYVEHPDHFIKFTFPVLLYEFQKMDFRTRYKDTLFPIEAERFKLGGHDKELGHIHIDFLKRGDAWVIEKIWCCR